MSSVEKKIFSFREIVPGETHTWDEVVSIALKTAETLNAIYKREKRAIVNLRPENIFLEPDRIRIEYEEKSKECDINEHQTLRDFYEDSAFLAPEVNNGEIGFESDIYSLGAVFYVLFGGDEADIIEDNESIKLPGKMHSQLKKLILSMLATDKTKRPNINRVIKKLTEIKYFREHVTSSVRKLLIFFLFILAVIAFLKKFIEKDIPNTKTNINKIEVAVDVFSNLNLSEPPKTAPERFEKNLLSSPLRILVKRKKNLEFDSSHSITIENYGTNFLRINVREEEVWYKVESCVFGRYLFKCDGIMKKDSNEMILYAVY